MYEKYFGLNKSPFLMTPDPSALLLTTGHREALAGLSYGALNRKGFVVLTGEAGTGKTTLLRRLLQLGADAKARCSVVFNPLLTPSEFLELLLINFGVRSLPASKALRLLKLERLLNDTHQAGQAAVLIVDEAHKLSYEVFEEIRLLTNFETSEQKLLQIVLSGQPELTGVLNHPTLWQLKQRIAVRLHIDPLSPEDVKAFIEHRWARAGGAIPHPFTEDAIALIALWSQGIPRLVNSLCDNGLLQAIGQERKTVGADDVLQVIVDLDLPVPLRRSVVADAEKTRNALIWSRQAARELKGTLDQEQVLSGAPVQSEAVTIKSGPSQVTLGTPGHRTTENMHEAAPEMTETSSFFVAEPVASAARVGIAAGPTSLVEIPVGPAWNGRPSNGNPSGLSPNRGTCAGGSPSAQIEGNVSDRPLFERVEMQRQKLA